MRLKAFLKIILLFVTIALTGYANAGKTDYILGPGDVVKVTVYDHDDMTTEARIKDNNAITFPLIGDVKIGGKTPSEAEQLIATMLNKGGFVMKPQINLVVTLYSSQQVSVLGEVNKPGKYPLQSKSTILDLLATAGGVNQLGGDTVTLMRQTPSGTTRQQIDINDITSGKIQDMYVQGDDVIYVPRASQFYVYGEVQRPGMYRLERNMTVMQAISVGGGFTQRANEKGVSIKRKNAKGEVITESTPDLNELLKPDDVVYVKESWF